MCILLVREGGHQRSGRSACGLNVERWSASNAIRDLVRARVAFGKGVQGVDVIMLGYDIQGPVLSNKMDSFHRTVVLASFGVLKDGGRHVESGGLACFS
jgi:hypothetical protein